jgi:hypothetical protein
MSLSVEEVLQNAEYNEAGVLPIQRMLAKEQRSNYEIAKQLGAKDEDDWYDWEDKVETFKQNN